MIKVLLNAILVKAKIFWVYIPDRNFSELSSSQKTKWYHC
jgi:hypothetical protein